MALAQKEPQLSKASSKKNAGCMNAAVDIADYYIFLASEGTGKNDEANSITNLKLQILLYYTQAQFLCLENRLAFSEELESREYGPVVPEVYDKYKHYGDQPIFLEKDDSEIPISADDKNFLRGLWDAYGIHSGEYMQKLTLEHPPVKDAYERKSPNKTIRLKTLKKYYKYTFTIFDD